MKYAITGGKVYTVTNGVIENGTVLVENGKIVAVGSNIEVPSDAKVIDATNKWVTPGLIDAHSHIGLWGEPNVPMVMDFNEITNPITAEVRGMDSINPQDPAIKLVREHGVTSVYTGPGSANIIGGTGVAIKLRGTTVEEMIYPGTEGMKMALGENPKRCYGTNKKSPMTRMGNAAVLRKALVKAQNYLNKIEQAKKDGKPAPDRDLQLEMIGKVLSGEYRARIHAHRADDIITAIRVSEEFGLKYSIEHCTEGYRITDVLADKNVTAIVGPLLMGPSKQELWDVRMTTPAVLVEAGVNVCLNADVAGGTRWLPVHVGLAMRAGLTEEDAFKSVTINPAEFLGINDKVGSLEEGKDADIVVWDGHPFCNFTAVEVTMIDGNIIYQK
ncbi:amidohydrolase [Clostridium sp. 'deep sea']|uniref:amidohydrolase n=1 Tax=Clostridium sp. 'deep sea' TaxID=2779445 RepID=UPI0018965CEB|nr:amidohydrolase [Clostridium sp. 'deep sea']QOR35647.1 amidohydrolase [Clostridium sp. 'deep sea']